jgi:tRNA-specific 2-thiouridylase
MSGGVDSSVAAALLLEQGFDVVGCFMRLGSPGETLDELTPDACPAPAANTPRTIRIGHQGCCSITDAADARHVAAKLGIPLYICNFKQDFSRVIGYFVDEYANGRTPNPCVRCNDWLKFGKLHDYAQRIGATFVASGHYARVRADKGGDARRSAALLPGVDPHKDQSYVLFGIPREQLASTLFPVGHLPKPDVRARARELGLLVSDKPDSQEICFVPDNDYAGLVERQRPDLAKQGAILDTRGNTLGTHPGHHRFTIGQRRGLSLATGERVYVVAKDPAANTVTIGEPADLLRGACEVGEANWLVADPSRFDGARVLAKFRSNSAPVPARLRVRDDDTVPTPSGRTGRFAVEFAQPQTAVAPGQALVLYDQSDPDQAVIGGGWISAASR